MMWKQPHFFLLITSGKNPSRHNRSKRAVSFSIILLRAAVGLSPREVNADGQNPIVPLCFQMAQGPEGFAQGLPLPSVPGLGRSSRCLENAALHVAEGCLIGLSSSTRAEVSFKSSPCRRESWEQILKGLGTIDA